MQLIWKGKYLILSYNAIIVDFYTIYTGLIQPTNIVWFLEKKLGYKAMLHAYLSTCPECFFLFTLLTGVLVKPGIIFRLGMSFSCGENWRVKHSNCVHFERGWRTPPPSQMWEVQRWRSAVTAHREKPTWPPILDRPITKLLAWQLFPGAHIYFQDKICNI